MPRLQENLKTATSSRWPWVVLCGLTFCFCRTNLHLVVRLVCFEIGKPVPGWREANAELRWQELRRASGVSQLRGH